MNIPAEWVDLLQRIQAVLPSAVIAGGALRDLDNNREVKDLDIFIRGDSVQECEWHLHCLREAGFEVNYNPSELTEYPEDQNLEVVVIASLETYDDLPVQLIFTNWDTASIVDRFDYGICRLSFDGKELVRPAEYDEDKQAQVFRLRRERPTAVSMRGSIRRYARLTAEKYQGWDWYPYENPCPFDAVCG